MNVSKKNPKHSKKAFYERKKQYDTRNIPIKYFVMGFIFVISITGVVLLAIFLPDSINDHGDKLFIEDGDTAELHYKLWKVDEIGDLDTSKDPYQESLSFITSVTKDSLINGFYYELLDREIGKIIEFVIDKEIDANSDGLDDDTGEEILGYADGTILFFWVQVINITKSAENSPAANSLDNIELPFQMENFSENNFQCYVREFFIFEFLNNS